MTAADAHRAILAVWRIEQPRLITSLARMLRDVPLAEDLTQEALLTALERWPATGVPEKPGAWLMATAKRRALDHLRRGRILERKHEMVAQEMEAEQQTMPDLDSALDDDIGDELLRLIFTACHPRLSRDARTALALRMICGLTTEEIARAFLLPDATIAQRIVRAKRTLSESGLGAMTGDDPELATRHGLARPLGYIGDGERWKPLLLLNTTSVDTGRRLIASELAPSYRFQGNDRRVFPEAYDLFEMLPHADRFDIPRVSTGE